MTITFPDAAAASAIATVAAAIVWAIRTITNKHVATLDEQVNQAKLLLPTLQEALRLHQDVHVIVATVPGHMARMRRALYRLAPQVLICDECQGWFGEQDEKPRVLDMCRCSEADGTGPHRATAPSIPGSMPGSTREPGAR